MISRPLSSASAGMAVKVQTDIAAAAKRCRMTPVPPYRITFLSLRDLLSALLPLSHEAALRGWGARVHVASPVQVVVGLGGAPDHAGVEEERERGRFQCRCRAGAAAVGLPQDLQQQRCDH